MARTFNGSTQALSRSVTCIADATAAFTMGCWFNTSSYKSAGIFQLGLAAGAKYVNLLEDSTGYTFCEARTDGTYSDSTLNTTSLVVGTWYYGLVIWAPAVPTNHFYCYCNGSTDVQAFDGNDNITGAFAQNILAQQNDGGTIVWFAGTIAFPAVWNVALTTTEIDSLATGINPRKIRPQSLVSYSRLPGVSPEPDMMSSATWSLVATPTVGVNPRIYAP